MIQKQKKSEGEQQTKRRGERSAAVDPQTGGSPSKHAKQQPARRQTNNHALRHTHTNMRVSMEVNVHSYAATDETDTGKQSLSARKGRLVNDIQNQKGEAKRAHSQVE